MNIKILEKKEAPLLSRTEVKAQLTFSGATPSTSEVTKALAKNLSADEKTVLVRDISTKFGFKEAKATAHVYKKEEDMKRIEPTHFFKTEKPKEEVKPAEAPAAEKPAAEAKAKETPTEAPKEEKTEEAPTEEKSVEEAKSEEKSE